MSAILRTAATGVLRRHWVLTNRGRWESGWLVEPAVTNAVLRSEDLGTTWSTSNASVTANAAVAPDGATTADVVVETGGTASHGVTQSYTCTSGATQAVSVFAKFAGGRQWLALQVSDAGFANSARAWFDVRNGVVGASGVVGTGTYTAHYMTAVGDGWWRCTLIGRPAPAVTTAVAAVFLAPSDNVISYASAGLGLLAWGAQAENAATASTSYIPTVGSTVTRSADSLTRTVVGTPAERPQRLTLYARAIATAVGEGYFAELKGGVDVMGIGRGIGLGGAAGAYTSRDDGSSVTASTFPLTGIVAGDVYEVAATYTPTLLTVRGARNHGVEVSGTSAVSLAFDATWASAASLRALASPRDVVTHVAVLAGTRTLAECRAATGAA